MKPTAPEPPRGRLALVLACPKCGGPFTVDDEVMSLTCGHCGSLLILTAPERDEIYIAEGHLATPADVLEMVIEYRVQGHRAEIISRYKSGEEESEPPPEVFVQARLRAYEAHLRQVAHVVEATRFHVPYWHITGKIVQGVLGRHADGPKLVRLRAFAVEHTVPGYDPLAANLRDGGLRMAASRVHPLTARGVQEQGPFLPWIAVPEQSYRDIDKWRGQDLERGLEPVTKLGLFLFARRMLVYRPYWLARLFTDKSQEWVLADSGFRTIAGYPDELESRSLLKQGITDPLRSGEESFRRVHIGASRCPDCGFEEAFDSRFRIVICPNCHLALASKVGGIEVVPYAHGVRGQPDLDGAYLPFWRYDFRIAMAGAAPLSRLEDYAKALFPQGLPGGFHARGDHLWIPAFRLLGTEPGDEVFKEVVEWIHGDPPVTGDGKIPLGGKPAFWGVSVPEDEARTLGVFALLGLHGKASAARLNTLLVKRAIRDAKLTLENPRLVMVPFDRTAESLRIEETGVSVPSLLLRGGPELEAMRVTVHAAQVRGG